MREIDSVKKLTFFFANIRDEIDDIKDAWKKAQAKNSLDLKAITTKKIL